MCIYIYIRYIDVESNNPSNISFWSNQDSIWEGILALFVSQLGQMASWPGRPCGMMGNLTSKRGLIFLGYNLCDTSGLLINFRGQGQKYSYNFSDLLFLDTKIMTIKRFKCDISGIFHWNGDNHWIYNYNESSPIEVYLIGYIRFFGRSWLINMMVYDIEFTSSIPCCLE
jgi:hypothetical protein